MMSENKVISIHQPAFAPWLGFVECMFAADYFVLFDDVQFEKGGVQNRNKIKSLKGIEWITIPVTCKFGTQLNKVEIASNYKPSTIIRALSSSYGSATHFKKIMPDIEQIISLFKPGDFLCDLNIMLLKWISNALNCSCEFILSSHLQIEERNKMKRIGEICSKLKSTHLYTGTGMLQYSTPESILEIGVIPIFHNYQKRHLVYQQCFRDTAFISCLSILDLILNVGYNVASEQLNASSKKILNEAFETNTIFFSN